MSMDYPRDFIEYGFVSDCCGANIIHGDICMECNEHAELEEIKDDKDEWICIDKLSKKEKLALLRKVKNV